ncbi:MAG: hypothetical protein P0119_08530 [Nitrospira sp.]|nr:hypothetical protein [Nitrospira sp.]
MQRLFYRGLGLGRFSDYTVSPSEEADQREKEDGAARFFSRVQGLFSLRERSKKQPADRALTFQRAEQPTMLLITEHAPNVRLRIVHRDGSNEGPEELRFNQQGAGRNLPRPALHLMQSGRAGRRPLC